MKSTKPAEASASREIASFLFSFAIAMALFGILAGGSKFWDSAGLPLLPSSTYTVSLSLFLMSLALMLAQFKIRTLRLSPVPFAWGLVFLFLSDWLCRNYNFFQGPTIRGEIVLMGLLFFWLTRRFSDICLNLLLLLSVLLLIGCFLTQSGYFHEGSQLLFSDDHPTFFFRLSLLKENFPSIPFYYPFWNGGMDARDFFATGSLNIFLLASPLLYIFDLRDTYNLIVLGVLFIFVPSATYLAARIERLPSPAPAIASILALSTGLLWYRWALKYGTMGFITTASLVPLNLVLLSKLISPEDDIRRSQAILLVLSLTLMLFWTPSALVFIPIGLCALKDIIIPPHRLLKRQYFLPIALSVLLINLPWMLAFCSVSNLPSFLSANKAAFSETIADQDLADAAPSPAPQATSFRHKDGAIDFKKSLKVLRETAISTNPLLLFLLIPGIALLRLPSKRIWILTSLWLVVLGSIIVPIKPQLEFDRMLVILSLCAALPTALALQHLWQDFWVSAEKRSFLTLLPALLCGGFLCTAPLSTGAILLNRSTEHYSFASDLVPQMTKAIETNADDGRILFSGFTLHELSGGHLAPLTVFSGKPLLASSQFHNLWKYTQIFPESFLSRGDAGIQEYLNLYNVSAVMAHEKYWRDYFSNHPDGFELAWRMDRFSLFRRKNFQPSYFLRGTGEVIQEGNGLQVKPNTQEVVLKFNYFPFLQASDCELGPEQVAPEVQFIRLKNCSPGQIVQVKSTSLWRRVFR